MHTQCGNHTVEEYFDEEERSRVGAYIFGIGDKIPSNRCMGAVRLLYCTNGADKFDVCDILESIGRGIGFGDEFNGVGTFYPSAYTLCKASKFIGSGSVSGIF